MQASDMMEISRSDEGGDGDSKEEESSPAARVVGTGLPEVQVYLHLLVLILLLDRKHYAEAARCAEALVARVGREVGQRRTLSPLAARAYFYYWRAYERLGRLGEIRSTLLAAHRSAALRHDEELQAVLLNVLAASYLAARQYEQAAKLLAQAPFPEAGASPAHAARHLYYLGRIKAIELDYSEAYRCLQQALRRAPTRGARGFRLAAQRLLVLVQLLVGEVPERRVFEQPGLRRGLAPYRDLAHSVHRGDLLAFQAALQAHAPALERHGTLSLVQRLRHNVIKAGLRKIALAYSRIPLAEVARRLRLEGPRADEDAEYLVAKAIRDGVIEARIDRAGRYMAARDRQDLYATQEPLEAYAGRVQYCLELHNEAVRAMRFPDEARREHEDEEAVRRERHKAQLSDLADLHDEEDGDF
jgi:26S proteasome regulatory subunit N3